MPRPGDALPLAPIALSFVAVVVAGGVREGWLVTIMFLDRAADAPARLGLRDVIAAVVDQQRFLRDHGNPTLAEGAGYVGYRVTVKPLTDEQLGAWQGETWAI